MLGAMLMVLAGVVLVRPTGLPVAFPGMVVVVEGGVVEGGLAVFAPGRGVVGSSDGSVVVVASMLVSQVVPFHPTSQLQVNLFNPFAQVPWEEQAWPSHSFVLA